MVDNERVLFNPRVPFAGTLPSQIEHGSVLNLQTRVPQPIPPLSLDSQRSFQVEMSFHGTHTMVVVPEMTIDELTAHFISIPACRDKMYLEGLHLEHVRFYISGRTLALGQSNLGRLAIGSGPAVDGSRKLEDYNIQANATITVSFARPGGAKKGAKPTTSKGERMAQLRARVQYQHTQITTAASAQLVQQVSQPGYIQWALNQMSLEQMQNLKQVADDIHRSDKIAESVDTLMIPELAQMQAQKEELEKTIKALSQAFECTFADNYTNDQGFNVDPFYTAIEDRVTALQNQRVQDQIQHAQAQAVAQAQAQMQAAQAQASGSADAAMQDI